MLHTNEHLLKISNMTHKNNIKEDENENKKHETISYRKNETCQNEGKLPVSYR